jgi:anti-sigma B factor antagonist
MAIHLPRQMRTSGHSNRKELLPLLNDNPETAARTEMNIVAVKDDGALVILHGRIDMDSSPALRDRLLALLRAAYQKKVNIDLSAVTHIDSSAIATLIEALKMARANNAELTLQGLNDRLLRFFELTGLLPLFNGTTPAVTESGQRAV